MSKIQSPSPAAAPAVGTASPETHSSATGETAVSKVKVRILRDCVYGLCDAVVSIDSDLIEPLAGVVDAHPDAVAYAESLK